MKSLQETTPQRIRRVCVAPGKNEDRRSPSRLFPFSILFLVLGTATVAVIVALVITRMFSGYTDLLIRLSRGF